MSERLNKDCSVPLGPQTRWLEDMHLALTPRSEENQARPPSTLPLATSSADLRSSLLISSFHCRYLDFNIPGGCREFRLPQDVTSLRDKKDNGAPITFAKRVRYIFAAGIFWSDTCVCKGAAASVGRRDGACSSSLQGGIDLSGGAP